MSTPPTKQPRKQKKDTSDVAYPSQEPVSMEHMTQCTQGSVDGSISGLSNLSSDHNSNGPEDAVVQSAMVTPRSTGKKQITMTQYARSAKQKRKQSNEEKRAEEMLEDDDVTFVKTEDEVKNQCIHCHSNPCHDTIFGVFCSEDTRNYIRTGWYTESRVYNYFVASYKGAKKYRQWTKTGKVSFDMQPTVPSCLFNASYGQVVKELRDDCIREKWGKKRRLVSGNVFVDMTDDEIKR